MEQIEHLSSKNIYKDLCYIKKENSISDIIWQLIAIMES
jgi:hypothetical protein